ncbi:MAG: hypothetical protein COA70_13700 [Planctomycetota bacterium]|nr:MAG: hypothetical protein COA70_13700 [Planctomycetota bacterium]
MDCPYRLPLSLLLACTCFFASSEVHAQNDFEEKRMEAFADAGKRHLELGMWCRKRGLDAQASAQFYAAVEASESKYIPANRVLSLMKGYGDAFWKDRPTPKRASFSAYAKKAKKMHAKDEEGRLDLAKYAWKKKMPEQAEMEYESILRKRAEPLDFDKNGKLKIAGESIPDEISQNFHDRAVAINDVLYLRDEFLSLIPDIDAIQQVESEALRVRSTLTLEETQKLFQLAEALMPQLEQALHARPGVRLNLFLFPDRISYEAYIDTIGKPELKAVTGFAQRNGFTAVVCMEGLDIDALYAITLHELTHLYTMSVSRSVMPSWYAEGFAEYFAGQGTMQWDGTTLTTCGLMAEHRIASLRNPTDRFTLDALFSADALSLFAEDRDKALRFYVQSWAFMRFMRLDADKKIRQKFLEWESQCHGGALGAEVGNTWASNQAPAMELFHRKFGDDLEILDIEFQKWLQGLVGT